MTRGFIRARTGLLLTDLLVPASSGGYWPHLCDLYVPQGCHITRAVVVLHGGGGNKGTMPQSCGISMTASPAQSNVNWDLLQAYGAAVLIPQGQHVDGVAGPYNPNGATSTAATWSNDEMWSGVNDLAFLADAGPWMLATLQTEFGAGPGLQRCLFGHSNGGMMAQKVWQEAPGSWDAIGSACGPLSALKDTTPIVAPAAVIPIYTSWSLGDAVVGIKNGPAGIGSHFWEDSWVQNPVYQSTADVYYPDNNQFIAGWRSFAWQVGLSGYTFNQGDGVATRQHGGGMLTKWGYGPHRMELLDLGSHALDDQTAVCGLPQAVRWLDWAKSL